MRLLLLLVVALSALWLVLIRGYSDYMARVDPARALRMHSQQPEALIRLAEAALAREDLSAAEDLARRAVAAAPLEGRAFRILGAVADLGGDSARAATLMDIAARLSPRDTATQFWLVLSAIRQQDLDTALARVDRLQRFQPETQPQMMPLLTAIASNPAGAGPLAQVLAGSPPWRDGFFAEFVRAARDTRTVASFINALRRAGTSLTGAEREVWMQRLAREYDWPRLRRLLNEAAPNRPALADGSFELGGRGPFSGWVMPRSPGIEATVAERGAEGGRALRLEFFERRAQIQVEQVLIIAPGSWSIRGWTRMQKLEAPRGLQWKLSCIPGGAVIGESALLRGTQDWSRFEFSASVPAADCGGQLLKLEVSARIAAELAVSGVAWFDELEVVPMEAQ